MCRSLRTARLLAVVLVPTLVFTACGGGDDEGGDQPVATLETTETTVDLTPEDPSAPSVPPTKPDVSIPAEVPTELVITVLVEGSGAPAAEGDILLVDYVGVRSVDGVEFDNSYDRGQPFPLTLGGGGVIAGWDQGLVGAKAGSRVQLDIPAELAYGDSGAGEVIRPGDAITFVVDVRAIVPATSADDRPDVELQPSVGASEVAIDDLIVGDGAVVVDGSTAFVHLIAVRGDDLQVLESTWESGSVQVRVAKGQLIEGLYTGIVGMRAGGRRVVTIPAELAFGAEGNAGLGVPPGTDLIMVLDVIAVV
jgi:FKBP-type peptidyl-prolyl cis-trans isomerase